MLIAADVETALAQSDWRRNVSWPVSLAESNAFCVGQVRDALASARSLDDRLMRDAALLALPVILAYARAIVLAAMAIGRAGRRGDMIAGAAPEIGYLLTGDGPPPVRTSPVLPPAKFGLAYARRVARTRSWTRLSRMPRALLWPSAVAVGHNSLLRDVAQHEAGGVAFRHAEIMLPTTTSGSIDVGDAARALAGTMVQPGCLDEPYRSRSLGLVEAVAHAHLGKAARDMAALRGASLPGVVWSGSGGLYAPRAIGLEVLRRGGQVRRFDHGTPREFARTVGITDLLELSVSSEFTLVTEAAATICRRETRGVAATAKVTGANGDPLFRRASVSRPRSASGARLRVVYAPTQLLGFRQLVPALPPDPVYLDWQLRVAEFLNALPVDFICQAHPEGLFGGKAHPLEGVVPMRRGNFQAQLREADVFVFDYPMTTALWEASCTNARIIYLDIGAGQMTAEIARLFAQRSIVLPVRHDEQFRMNFDEDALRDAVLAGGERADPAAFRCLLAGAA